MAKTVIRCKLERDGGTTASIGDIEYHFKPRPDLGAATAHVAEVEKKEHVNRFLQISDGYELFMGEDEDAPAAAVVPVVPDDKPVAVAEPEPEPEPASEPEPTPETAAPADAEDEDHEVDVTAPLDEQSDETLRAIYKALNHGHAAGPRTQRKTLIKKIEEIRDAQEG
jgi:hypothetical protein